MGRRNLKFNIEEEKNPLSRKNGEITVQEFLSLYDKFIEQKTLEGLRERTISDYIEHMKYIKKWLEVEQRTDIHHCSLDINFIRCKTVN